MKKFDTPPITPLTFTQTARLNKGATRCFERAVKGLETNLKLLVCLPDHTDADQSMEGHTPVSNTHLTSSEECVSTAEGRG